MGEAVHIVRQDRRSSLVVGLRPDRSHVHASQTMDLDDDGAKEEHLLGDFAAVEDAVQRIAEKLRDNRFQSRTSCIAS